MAPKPKKQKRAKTGGRKKGTPNKMTVGVKAALGDVFTWIGGVPAMAAWAKANPTEFYRLWVKTLPREVSGPGGKPIQYEDTTDPARGLTDAQLAARLAAARSRVAAAGADRGGSPRSGAEPATGGEGPTPSQ